MSRRFLVTGGSQGIGAAIVHAAREAGHQVVFTGRNQGHIDATVKATGAEGIKADQAAYKATAEQLKAEKAKAEPEALAAPARAERRFRTFDSLIDVPAFRWYMVSQIGNQSAQLMQMVVRRLIMRTASIKALTSSIE